MNKRSPRLRTNDLLTADLHQIRVDMCHQYDRQCTFNLSVNGLNLNSNRHTS